MADKALETFYGHLQEKVPAFRQMGLNQFEQNISDPQKQSKFYNKLKSDAPDLEEEFLGAIGQKEPQKQKVKTPIKEDVTPVEEEVTPVKQPNDVVRPYDYNNAEDSFYDISDEELAAQISALQSEKDLLKKQIQEQQVANQKKKSFWDKLVNIENPAIAPAQEKIEVNNARLSDSKEERLKRLTQEQVWRQRQAGGEYEQLGKSLAAARREIEKIQGEGPTNLSLEGAKRYLDKAEKLYKSPSKYGVSNGMVNWGQGLVDQLSDYDTWTAGVTEAARAIDLNLIVNKLNKLKEGESLNPSDEAKLNAFLLFGLVQQARKDDMSMGYSVGKGAAESIPFMAEMFITAGAGAAAKKAIVRQLVKSGNKSAANRLARALGSEIVENTVTKKAGKKVSDVVLKEAKQSVAEKVARQVGEDVLMTTFMPTTWANVAEDAVDEKLNGDGDYSFTDFLRTMSSATLETGTEHWGGKIVDKTISKVLPLDKIWGKTRWGKIFTNDFIQSPIGETGEEYVGALANYIRSFNPLYSAESNEQLRQDARDMFSISGFCQTFLTVLPMSAFGGTANMVSAGKNIRDYNSSTKKLTQALMDAGATEDQADNIIWQIEGSTDTKDFTEKLTKTVQTLRNRYMESNPDASVEETKKYFKSLDKIVGEYYKSAYYLNELSGKLQEAYDNLTDEQKQKAQQDFEDIVGTPPIPFGEGDKAHEATGELLSTGTNPIVVEIDMPQEDGTVKKEKISFRSNSYKVMPDGTIDADKFTLLSNGKPLYGDKKAAAFEAFNAAMSQQKQEADADVVAQEVAQEAQANAEVQEQAAEQQAVELAEAAVQAEEQRVQEVYAGLQQQIEQKGIDVISRFTPEQKFIYTMMEEGLDAAVEDARSYIAAAATEKDPATKRAKLKQWNALLEKYAPEQQKIEENTQTTPVQYKLSDEIDNNGKQFVLNSNGELAFGEIEAESGLPAAPILLSEGEITNPATNDGYGLVHIEARHGDQIRKAGYKSVIDFIENVAKNWEVIKKGKNRDGRQTYFLQLTDEHNNTLIVELSGDGTYWNINTAGIFRNTYGNNFEEVYRRHATEEQPVETVEESQEPSQSDTNDSSSMNSSTTSEHKDTTNNLNTQENSEKNAEKVDSASEMQEITEVTPAENVRKAPGFKKGMVVTADDVWIVNKSGHLSLVQSKEKPAKAVEKEFVYFDNGQDGPYLLWPFKGDSLSKPRLQRQYVDKEGTIKTVDSASLVKKVGDEFVPVPAPQRVNVTSFDTILNSKIRVEGEEISLADVLKVKRVGKTQKQGGEGVSYLSGYQILAQHINERTDLSDEQKEKALAAIRDQINSWIREWNSFASNVLINATGLKEKDLMPVYAMNLSIYRDTRDKYAKEGNIDKVKEIQAKILDVTFKVSSADENTLKRENFFNPLYQLSLMVDVAQNAGLLNEKEVAVGLPARLKVIANSEIVTPKDIENARSIYAKEKEKKHKTGALEAEFPEVLNDLPALIRFAQPKEQGKTPKQSNKWYDSRLKEVYKQMGEKLAEKAAQEAGGEALQQLKDNLVKAVEAIQANDMDSFNSIKEEIETIMSEHEGERAFETAFKDAQKRINTIMRAADKETADKVDALAKRRQLQNQLDKIEAELDGIRKRESKKEKEGKAHAERWNIERLSTQKSFVLSQIQELEETNEGLAEQFAAEQKLAEEVAAIQEMEAKLQEQPKNAKESAALASLIEQYDDYVEKHPEAKARVDELRKEKKNTLSLDIQPELAVVSEEDIPAITPMTRVALTALRRVIGWAGIQMHHAGNQEDARRVLAELQGTPELETYETPNGVILGWAIGNEIYLTDEGLNSETPIHEYTHLWVKSLRNEKPEAWDKIKELCKKNKQLWNSVKNDPAYESIKDDEDAIASEMLSRFSGKRGAARLEEEIRNIVNNSKVKSDKLVDSLINNMRNTLQEFWRVIKELLRIDNNVKLEEVADLVLKDLFDGKPLNLNTQEMNEIKEQAIKDGTFMKSPTGNDTNLTERQWLAVRTKAFKEYYGDWEDPNAVRKYYKDAQEGEHVDFLLDENLEPLIVYHGTEHAGFDEMIPQDKGEANGRGIFTTPQRYVAGIYAKLLEEQGTEYEARIGQEEKNGIYSLFANIKNPLVVDCTDQNGNPSMWHSIPTGVYKIVGPNMATQYFMNYEDAVSWMYENGFGLEWNEGQEEVGEPEIIPETLNTDQFVDMAKAQGYDGVVFKNIIDGTDSELMEDDDLYKAAHDVVVAFTSNQLKSAVSNNGLYSQEEARIEYQNAEEELSQLGEPAEKLIRKQEDEGTVQQLDPDLSEQEESNWWESVVTRMMDQSNGMRIMLNSINAYRKMKGLEPLDGDKYDVRTKYEACRSIIANKIGFLERGIGQELDDYLRELADVVEKSAFYQQYMKEVGGENPTTLTPIQFIERYLMARNNWERAKEGVPRGIAEFKERMGYTDAEGKVHHVGVIEFANAFKDAYGEEAVLKLWDKIRKMTDFALDTNLEGGLISQELYDELKAKKFYVPQRGFWDDVNPENEEKEETDQLLRRTSGDRVARNKLDSMHKAEGGKSLAEGCLVYIQRDARQAILMSEENKVKKVMFDVLRENEDWCHEPEHNFHVPRQVFYQDDGQGGIKVMDDGPTDEQKQEMRQLKNIVKQLKEEYQKAETEEEKEAIAAEIEATEAQYPYFDEKDSFRILHSRVAGQYDSKGLRKNRKAKAAKAIVGLYIDGVPCEIEMTPRFVLTADALNGRRDPRGVLSGLRSVTAWLSAQFTMNNPTFFAVNITRDTPLILTKGAVEYGPEFSARFTANWAISQKAIWKYLVTGEVEDTNVGAQLYDFLMGGGNTGYSNLEELQKWRRRVSDLNPGGLESLRRELASVEGAKKVGKALLAAGKGTLNVGDKVLSWAELRPLAQVLNEWSEIISRFSAYKAVVDMGYGVNEGIHAAHNLSTNFNRKGLGEPFINFFNSLTVFANAGIQGAAGYWRTLDAQGGAGAKAKKIAKTAAYMGMLPAFLGFLCTMFNPDDDEYEYMVSEYERDNYVVLGDKRFALNEQLKPWWVIGVNAALLCRGKRTMSQACNSVVTSMFTNWLPLPPNITGSANMLVENISGQEEWNIAQIARTSIMPSAMQTMNQWADNKNFLGGKLRYDIGDIPEYEMAPNEAELYKDIAYAFYVLGGGNELVPSKTREDGSKIRRWWDVNPKEIKSNTFFIPSGALDNFCLAYGLAKDVKQKIGEDYTGTNVRVKDLPVINRFYKPSDKSLYRYSVVRVARDMTERHQNQIDNYKKQVRHFSDVYAQTGDEQALKSKEEARRLLVEERSDVTLVEMNKILGKYNKYSIRALQNKLGESNKEVNQLHGKTVENLDKVEKDLVQRLLIGENLKTGLKHSTDVPEWIEWFDDRSPARKERREK